MKTIGWFSRLSNQQHSLAMILRAAGGIGLAILLMTGGIAVAQDNPTPANPLPKPESQMTVPHGYSIHESVDVGGRIASISGSGAMYDTLVNLQTGPRLLGETFEMRARPETKHTLFDSLRAIGNGLGGDPYNFAKLDFSKGKIYEFSGLFRRDRQYFDYDLLGNPNIQSGLSIPFMPSPAAWAAIPTTLPSWTSPRARSTSSRESSAATASTLTTTCWAIRISPAGSRFWARQRA